MLPRDQLLKQVRSSDVGQFEESSERGWQNDATSRIFRILGLGEYRSQVAANSKTSERDTAQLRDSEFNKVVPFPFFLSAKKQYSLQLDKDRRSSFPKLMLAPWASPLFRFYREEAQSHACDQSGLPLLLCLYRANIRGGLALHTNTDLANSSVTGGILRAPPTEDFPSAVYVQSFDHFLHDMKKYFNYGDV